MFFPELLKVFSIKHFFKTSLILFIVVKWEVGNEDITNTTPISLTSLPVHNLLISFFCLPKGFQYLDLIGLLLLLCYSDVTFWRETYLTMQRLDWRAGWRVAFGLSVLAWHFGLRFERFKRYFLCFKEMFSFFQARAGTIGQWRIYKCASVLHRVSWYLI